MPVSSKDIIRCTVHENEEFLRRFREMAGHKGTVSSTVSFLIFQDRKVHWEFFFAL